MVLTRKYPEQIPDLSGYQSLIIEAHLEYESDNWLAYDRQFRLNLFPFEEGACVQSEK